MNQVIRYLLSLAMVALVCACGKDGDGPKDPNEKPDPTAEPTPSVKPDETEDPNMLYNGIILPGQWPPQRNYRNDIRRGMTPFYLNSKPAYAKIDVGRQLFVDNFLISTTTLKRVYHYPEYHSSNPVLAPDKDWEQQGKDGGCAAPFSDGVWYDELEGKFKMWYMAGGGEYSTGGSYVTCYAESADGINWTKPALNVVQGTNIVRMGSVRDASSVWIDKQESDATRRYKMFEVSGGAGKWQYHYLTSSTGLSWRDNSTPSGHVADRSTVYQNPFRKVWTWSMRHNVRVNSSDPYTVRARDYMENSDPVTGNKAAVADLSAFWFGPWSAEQRHPRYSNNDGSPGIYNHDAIAYESIMLGQFTVWQGPENDICERDGVIKRNQVMLGYSRDGYSWYREDMNPFMTINDDDRSAWNNGNVQSAVGSPLIVGDKLYFYVSGRKLVNGSEVVSTGLATLRRDGFASMSGTGTLTTEALKFSGEYLFVNADVRGSLAVEVLDEKGNAIAGFGKDDCQPVSSDAAKTMVCWKGGKSLKALQGQKIRIKFHLSDGDLYSFWISDTQAGNSHGYTAGGGPGLSPTGIDK